MWQQILQQAMKNGNATSNQMIANSSRHGQKQKIGDMFSGPNENDLMSGNFTGRNNDPLAGGAGAGAGGAGAGVGGAGAGVGGAGAGAGGATPPSSDERVKEPTPSKDLLAQVAESLNNYTYHYRPGIGEKPNIEYSGPMAQELLQVDGYRSCVVEDPATGYLKVDTSRLALVNAGMIADLTKKLLFTESLIKQIYEMIQPQEAAMGMPDVE